jgi:glucose-1-phosphate thymidylyltransferase
VIAVLLCAGYATRMYPLTADFPKPLLPVAGKPVIDYLVEQIIDLPEITRIHVVTNAKFVEHFKTWQMKWRSVMASKKIALDIHNDGSTDNANRLGAPADLRFVFKQIAKPSKVLVSGGDNIFRFRLEPLWRDFLMGPRHYVIALPETHANQLMKTGVLALGKENRVLRLHEKPKHPVSKWFCPPLYFLQPTAWPRLDEFLRTPKSDDAPGYFIDFLSRKEKVYAFKLNASRLDIGSIDSYREAQEALSKKPCINLP